MDNLSDDLIELITKHLQLDDILSFSIINKENYKILNDSFYLNLALDIYGKEFWVRALSRPKTKSKPLNSMKLELIRVEKFQKQIHKSIFRRWTNHEFYNYWENNDEYYKFWKRKDKLYKF